MEYVPLCVAVWIGSLENLFFWKVKYWCQIKHDNLRGQILGYLARVRKLGNHRSLEGFSWFSPSDGTNFAILLTLAVDIKLNPGPRSQCHLSKRLGRVSNPTVECDDCGKSFHTWSDPTNWIDQLQWKIRSLGH